MDWQALLHNRWAVGGVVVAAGAGAAVLYRRRGSRGAAAMSTGTTYDPAAAGGPGTFDSTGTDVAAWLSSYSAGLQNQLNQGLLAYQQQLTDALAALGQVPTTGGPGAVAPPTGRVPRRYQLPPVAPTPPPRRRGA